LPTPPLPSLAPPMPAVGVAPVPAVGPPPLGEVPAVTLVAPELLPLVPTAPAVGGEPPEPVLPAVPPSMLEPEEQAPRIANSAAKTNPSRLLFFEIMFVLPRAQETGATRS